jgi:ATP-dependent DNA helicase PIF1
MISYHVAETVDRSFRYLMQNDKLFGGKVVVFCGDFRQLPPVVKHGKGEFYSLLNRDWFVSAPRAIFTKNFRLLNDESFDQMLQSVGDGILDHIEIPDKCRAQSLDEAIVRVFGDNVTDASNSDKVMLAYTLHQCSIVNDAVFEKIPGDISYSYAVDDLSECTQPDLYPSEYVATLDVSGCPPAMLSLKPKARYMIMRNLNPPDICNGITAELIRCTRYNCTLKLLSGVGKGNIICLPRCTFHVTSDKSGLPFNFKRRQFPLSPAYCLSVHKSQGQTLKVVGFVGDADAFSHGQVYVALSRVGSWDQFVFYSLRSETFIKNKVAKRLINAMRLM